MRQKRQLHNLVMPTDLKDHLVEIFYQRGDPAFTCGSIGHWCVENLCGVEAQINEGMDDEDKTALFEDGDGSYLFSMSFEPPDYELGGIGDGYWYFEKVKYKPVIEA